MDRVRCIVASSSHSRCVVGQDPCPQGPYRTVMHVLQHASGSELQFTAGHSLTSLIERA